MLAACTNPLSAGVKSLRRACRYVRARTEVSKANRPRGRDAKPRGSTDGASRAATVRQTRGGTKDLASSTTGPTIPSGGFTHMLHKLRAARSGREGLHAHRAPGRHPDHRHPRRDRPARVPQPARQGAGHRGQERGPHRCRPRWRRSTRTSSPTSLGDLTKLQAIEPALNGGKATPTRPDHRGRQLRRRVHVGDRQHFTITKADDRHRDPHLHRPGTYGCPTSGSW